MPKRRSATSPASATKKLRKPPSTRSTPPTNGVQIDGEVFPDEIEDSVVDAASSDEEIVDQVSEGELAEGNLIKEKNGVILTNNHCRKDWLGSLTIKHEIFVST